MAFHLRDGENAVRMMNIGGGALNVDCNMV